MDISNIADNSLAHWLECGEGTYTHAVEDQGSQTTRVFAIIRMELDDRYDLILKGDDFTAGREDPFDVKSRLARSMCSLFIVDHATSQVYLDAPMTSFPLTLKDDTPGMRESLQLEPVRKHLNERTVEVIRTRLQALEPIEDGTAQERQMSVSQRSRIRRAYMHSRDIEECIDDMASNLIRGIMVQEVRSPRLSTTLAAIDDMDAAAEALADKILEGMMSYGLESIALSLAGCRDFAHGLSLDKDPRIAIARDVIAKVDAAPLRSEGSALTVEFDYLGGHGSMKIPADILCDTLAEDPKEPLYLDLLPKGDLAASLSQIGMDMAPNPRPSLPELHVENIRSVTFARKEIYSRDPRRAPVAQDVVVEAYRDGVRYARATTTVQEGSSVNEQARRAFQALRTLSAEGGCPAPDWRSDAALIDDTRLVEFTRTGGKVITDEEIISKTLGLDRTVTLDDLGGDAAHHDGPSDACRNEEEHVR